jgi:hypothetical protein
MSKRKSRDKVSSKVDITKPLQKIDIMKFGTDDDPCFGKLHDFTADECRRCGDQVICQIVFNQKTLGLRGKIEEENRFKDLELINIEATSYAKEKLKSGKTKSFVTKRLVGKFKITTEQAKKIIKKIK